MAIDVESYILILNLLGAYSTPSTAAEKTALFADDGVLIVHGGTKYAGKSVIEGFFKKADESKKPGHPMRHHLSSIKIDILDGGNEARSTSYFLVMDNTAADHWGIYYDKFVRTNGNWLFKTRQVTIEGADPEGWIGSGAGPVKLNLSD